MPKIVTDPKRIVTDPLVLRQLARLGMDKDYVQLWHDYAHRDLGKEYNPYTKFYRDLKSGIHIMGVGGLPMVNADGVKICGDNHNETKVGWEQSGVRFTTKPNIFAATVIGLGIELVTLNDQPWGARKGDSVSWEPRLFLNGVEQYPIGSVSLSPTDPINENYRFNVLEWDYGICKRRIRVIEGRFRERWIFPANPGGDVRITHNFAGTLKVRLGYARDAEGNPLEVIVTDDEELIPVTSFAKAAYPVEIGAEDTFYPDADPETSSVDGRVYRSATGETWSGIRGGAGTGAEDNATYGAILSLTSHEIEENRWDFMDRGIVLFDTSGLPDGASITAAVLSLYGRGKHDSLSASPDVNIYSSSPSSNTALAAGDYGSLGTTAFATAITYASWSTTGYNDFTLNASGRAAISKTGVSKFGSRNANYDVANSAPTWSEAHYYDIESYFADQGTGYKPKLVVTYSVAKPGGKTAHMAAKMIAGKLI